VLEHAVHVVKLSLAKALHLQTLLNLFLVRQPVKLSATGSTNS